MLLIINALAPMAMEIPYLENALFLPRWQSDQRKLLPACAKAHFQGNDWNGQREIASEKQETDDNNVTHRRADC